MAERNKTGKTNNLKQDTLIDNLMPDPSQTPDLRVLMGFLGKSSRAGYWRVYLNLNLNEYVEFLEEDVLQSQALTTETHPLGGTLIWVRRDAEVLHTRTAPMQAQADFLQGGITSDFLGGTEMQGLSGSELEMARFRSIIHVIDRFTRWAGCYSRNCPNTATDCHILG